MKATLLAFLDQAYNRRSWHGTNLRGSIRGLSMDEAARRPGRGRHNVWEIVVHAAYWKYAVWRRLTGSKRGSFPLEGSNWFARPEARTEEAWRRDVALLERMHKDLRAAVSAMSERELRRRAPGSPITYADLVSGAAAHDLYHAGQIQLVKKIRS
jgi:uncharacterized damage-inducible protein DinB